MLEWESTSASYTSFIFQRQKKLIHKHRDGHVQRCYLIFLNSFKVTWKNHKMIFYWVTFPELKLPLIPPVFVNSKKWVTSTCKTVIRLLVICFLKIAAHISNCSYIWCLRYFNTYLMQCTMSNLGIDDFRLKKAKGICQRDTYL